MGTSADVTAEQPKPRTREDIPQPFTWNLADKDRDVALLGYFSYELPFRR